MPYRYTGDPKNPYAYVEDTPETRVTYDPSRGGYAPNDPVVGKTSLSEDLSRDLYNPGALAGTSAYDTPGEYGGLPEPELGPMVSRYEGFKQVADQDGKYRWAATDVGEEHYNKAVFGAREGIRQNAFKQEQQAAQEAWMGGQQAVEGRRKQLFEEEQRQAESNWNIEQQKVWGKRWGEDKALPNGQTRTDRGEDGKDPFKPQLWQRPEYQEAQYDAYNAPAFQAGVYQGAAQEKTVGSTWQQAAAQPGAEGKGDEFYWEEMRRPNLSKASRSGMTGLR